MKVNPAHTHFGRLMSFGLTTSTSVADGKKRCNGVPQSCLLGRSATERNC
jgi:hypothetical protein